MRAGAVVATAPGFEDDACLLAAAEPLAAQALVAELAVEAFVCAVLPRLSGIDIRGMDTGVDQGGYRR